MTEEADLKEAILRGAKAAREIGKSRERTFEIGEGLMALRSQCLIAMGRDPRINDRTILKSGEYRERMGAALKTYPAYTLATVFKNDSTRLAYMYCAEYRLEIETAFAEAEIANPGSTLRLTNPERIKAKFKALIDPPRKAKAAKAATAEAEAQEADMVIKKLREDVDHLSGAYDDLFARHVDFDTTPADKLAELLFDTTANSQGRKNRLAFIDLVVKYAGHPGIVDSTANVPPKPKAKRQRKAKAPDSRLATYEGPPAEEADAIGHHPEPGDDEPVGGFAPGVLEQIQGEGGKAKRKRKAKGFIVGGKETQTVSTMKEAEELAASIEAETGAIASIETAS